MLLSFPRSQFFSDMLFPILMSNVSSRVHIFSSLDDKKRSWFHGLLLNRAYNYEPTLISDYPPVQIMTNQ